MKATPMRLDKFLSQMGQGSRSQVKEMARKGRIQVNGQIVKAADAKVDPERDSISVDGSSVGYARMEYYMLNKPRGVVSARSDPERRTVIELIEDAVRKDLFPVGRLDIDTEGLLLITNDGVMAHNLLSPKKHVDKVYMAWIAGDLPLDAVERFAQGIELEDGTRTLPGKLELAGTGGLPPFADNKAGELDWMVGISLGDTQADKKPLTEAALTIREGKFHQVKRMIKALGCEVVYLKRISMGPLVLDPGLKPGQYRPLTRDELRDLENCSKVTNVNDLEGNGIR